MQDVKRKREDFMVSLFDAVYGEQTKKNKEVTMDEFKEKYVEMMEVSNRCVKESFAVNQLRNIIENKDYDDIETLFQLYLAQKEETQLLTQHLPQG